MREIPQGAPPHRESRGSHNARLFTRCPDKADASVEDKMPLFREAWRKFPLWVGPGREELREYPHHHRCSHHRRCCCCCPVGKKAADGGSRTRPSSGLVFTLIPRLFLLGREVRGEINGNGFMLGLIRVLGVMGTNEYDI